VLGQRLRELGDGGPGHTLNSTTTA